MQGTILGSRYRIIEYIAKGGFGKTYLAEDTQLPAKDKCVVKQLFPSVDDPNFIEIARRLFKTEAQTLNSLGVHDRIPQLLAYFEESEKFYLVQQYIEGHTLNQELISGQPWSEERVIELLQDCLNILDFVHSKGVIHRDVKPDNLIRRQSDNKLVLVDFGTVKEVIAEQTQLVPSTVAVGTRGYMPTEQARGKPRTTSDIYALGIIAIQALTGVHPMQLEEDESGEIVWQDKARCSLQLQKIIGKMTRYHFKERYQSAKDNLSALTDLNSKPEAPPQSQAVEYTPTVRLGDAELAALAKNPQGTALNSPDLIGDRSVTPSSNTTTFASASPESLGTSSQQIGTIDPSALNHESNSMPKPQKSTRTLATLGTALAIGAIASGGMYFLNRQSSKSAQNSVEEQVSHFQAMLDKKDYQGCYDEAVAINARSADADITSNMPKSQQQEFEAQCGLARAQQEAADLKYGVALELAKTLPKNTSIDTEIQQQVDVWSQQLLAKATKLYEREGDLAKAIEMVKQIPQDSSVRSQVIDAKDAWKAESKTNEAIITTAEKALSREKWRYAKQQATKVKDSSPSMYWQEKAKAIISQAEEGIGETVPKEVATPEPETPETTKAIAPTTDKVDLPATNKITKPVEPTVTTTPDPVISEPEPEPTVRVDQGSSGELRDLGGSSESLPGIPSNSAPPSNAPLRDL